MRYQLVILSLVGLLSACTDIELSKQVTPLSSQELPYKQYSLTGNICQTADGGLAVALLRNASNRGKDDYTSPYFLRNEMVIAKTSATGQLQWTKQVWAGTSASNSRPLLYVLVDGSYILFLTKGKAVQSSTTSLLESILLHLSATGELISQQTIEGINLPSDFTALSLVPIAAKGFVIKGSIYKNSLPVPYLLRFDEQGRFQWSRAYEQLSVSSQAYGLAATTDGGLILSSYGTNSVQATDGIVTKLDASGQSVWLKRYASVRATIISETADNGFVLLGLSPSPGNLPALFRLSPDGDVRWTQTYPLPANTYSQPMQVFASTDTYVAVHRVSSASSIEFLTTDLSGNEQGRQRVSVPVTASIASDIIRLANGSFALVISNQTGVSLLKIKSDKTTEWELVIATNT